MNTDIVEFRSFYTSLLGKLVERSIATALASVWSKMPEERLVGLGYALPWLEQLGRDAERVFAFMPARQGAVRWPSHGFCASALVHEDDLPLPDAAVDRIVMIHALEHAENPQQMLLEAWRVLAPGGRLVIVVPHRRGLWARFEHTPFGTGQPYSRRQLTDLLRDANFTPTSWADTLHFPPSQKRWLLRMEPLLASAGQHLWPLFAGALIVDAEKRLYQGIPAMARRTKRALVPVLSPQGATRGFRPVAGRVRD